ncbi:polymorphic toxin-type HINT domain-containing protein, partial [Frankia sp. ACN1ag]|uniref:polymorphic toxin-type HINT domain-containing protein n=1 Tax=Frankia sp. ACN1ag TaxID=102891 RepID=UPI0007072872
FDGATEVLLADGTRKRIEEVKVGDRVLATDPTTGRTEVHTVTAVIVGHGLKHLVDVTVATADGPRTLTATDHHPFWDDAHHGWVDADQLTSADRLRTPTGADVPVTATHDRDQTRTVYNLTVDTLHTYYVLAGTTPVLVHNSGGNASIDDNRLAHVEYRHGPGARDLAIRDGSPNLPGEFNEDFIWNSEDQQVLGENLRRGVDNSPELPNPNGPGHLHQYNFGRTIGINGAGNETNVAEIVVRDGRIWTAYPK